MKTIYVMPIDREIRRDLEEILETLKRLCEKESRVVMLPKKKRTALEKQSRRVDRAIFRMNEEAKKLKGKPINWVDEVEKEAV